MRLTNEQRSFARDLRRRQTDAERRLWHQLRARQFMGLRFRRQHPIGRFFADFACVELHLVIELDGGQHNSADERRRDVARSDVLAAGGYRVIRFWDNDVLRNTEAVLESIARTVEVLLAQQESQAESPHPRCARPLPPKRER